MSERGKAATKYPIFNKEYPTEQVKRGTLPPALKASAAAKGYGETRRRDKT